MVQNILLAIAVGLVEGVWLYFSLAKAERPQFGLLSRRSPAAVLPSSSPYAISEGQLV